MLWLFKKLEGTVRQKNVPKTPWLIRLWLSPWMLKPSHTDKTAGPSKSGPVLWVDWLLSCLELRINLINLVCESFEFQNYKYITSIIRWGSFMKIPAGNKMLPKLSIRVPKMTKMAKDIFHTELNVWTTTTFVFMINYRWNSQEISF